MRGNQQMTVDTLHAGDLGAVAKLGHTVTCDTLGDRGTPIIIEPPSFPIPVYSVAVFPATQADSAKMGPTLTRLTEDDPTLTWRLDPATKEAVLEGMGDVHVDVAIKRAARLGVNLETAVPKVPYRETITKVNSAQYRHKADGGAGQFARFTCASSRWRMARASSSAMRCLAVRSSSFIPSIEKASRA